MQRNKAKKELISFIEEELRMIRQLSLEIAKCRGNTNISRRAKGSILHDFYNACERIFEFIAREINGGIPSAEHWHKKLLHQMTIEVKGLRPAVVSKKLAAGLDEYLAFRHLFRNIYGFELESERLDRLAENFNKIVSQFSREIKGFIAKL